MDVNRQSDHEDGGIYILDDDFGVRDSLTALLSAQGYWVRPYASLDLLIEDVSEQAWGCLLLDVHMPGADGIALLPQLRERFQGLLPVMITAHANVDAAVTAMKHGAVDFIRKPWRSHDLIQVIDQTLDQARQRRLSFYAATLARARLSKLTPREAEVFEQLVTGAANKVIARRLDLSPRTVEFHRARILEKTRANSVAELVRIKVICDQNTPQ